MFFHLFCAGSVTSNAFDRYLGQTVLRLARACTGKKPGFRSKDAVYVRRSPFLLGIFALWIEGPACDAWDSNGMRRLLSGCRESVVPEAQSGKEIRIYLKAVNTVGLFFFESLIAPERVSSIQDIFGDCVQRRSCKRSRSSFGSALAEPNV